MSHTTRAPSGLLASTWLRMDATLKRARDAPEAAGEPKKKPKKKKQEEEKKPNSSPQPRKPLPPHKYILAPMVGGSELAFRMLCRRYATKRLLCYTPMMNSERFAAEPAYREQIFSTLPADRPLVGHFCGNDPATLLAAARHVEGDVDAIDLNLGCPQRIAHSGHIGYFLLDDVDRTLVCRIVATLAAGLSVPVFCKIRLLSTSEQTIELVRQLRDAGASLVAIHARHRVSLVGRSGPVARDGPKNLCLAQVGCLGSSWEVLCHLGPPLNHLSLQLQSCGKPKKNMFCS